MANQVAPQVDIGTLSLQGLSAFGPLLAALSADNVTSIAMLQLQALGDCFLTSGPYAAKVPDYLRRCTSVRLDRLALSVGWRKGDSASYMADSAGGQSVSQLCLCLFNVFYAEKAADILYDLSVKLLPRDTAIASMSQLFDVGRVLKSKLETLGFGNLLAQQVTRISDVYKHLGRDVPKLFFEELSTDATSELLTCISQALREEKTLVRITGSSGMAYILGITLMMFPRDVEVTVENLIICEGLRKSIIVEIRNDIDSRFQVETVLGASTQIGGLITDAHLKGEDVGRYKHTLRCSFTWQNWLKDFLQIKFLEVGLTCTPEVITACCNLLVLDPGRISISAEKDRKGCLRFFGENPQLRMRNCCQLIFGSTPAGPQIDVRSAFSDLVCATKIATSQLRCT